MFISNLSHFNAQFEFLKSHILDINKIFKNISFWLFIVTNISLNGNIQFLELIFCANQILHLVQVFYLVNYY